MIVPMGALKNRFLSYFGMAIYVYLLSRVEGIKITPSGVCCGACFRSTATQLLLELPIMQVGIEDLPAPLMPMCQRVQLV